MAGGGDSYPFLRKRTLDGGGTGGGVAGEDGFESMRGENLSLHDHLTTQAGAAFKGPDLIIADHLIDLIEENGYLNDSVDEVADRLGITPSEVAAVLTVLHGCHASGEIGRASWRERWWQDV